MNKSAAAIKFKQKKELLDKLMHQNIGYPLYFHGATTLYYYRKNEYKMALEEANKYIVRTLFWAPMLRAAVMGQLNLKAEQSNGAFTHEYNFIRRFEQLFYVLTT